MCAKHRVFYTILPERRLTSWWIHPLFWLRISQNIQEGSSYLHMPTQERCFSSRYAQEHAWSTGLAIYCSDEIPCPNIDWCPHPDIRNLAPLPAMEKGFLQVLTTKVYIHQDLEFFQFLLEINYFSIHFTNRTIL